MGFPGDLRWLSANMMLLPSLLVVLSPKACEPIFLAGGADLGARARGAGAPHRAGCEHGRADRRQDQTKLARTGDSLSQYCG